MVEVDSVSEKVVRLSAFEGFSGSVMLYILLPDFISNVTIFCQITPSGALFVPHCLLIKLLPYLLRLQTYTNTH
jgi:hypothetical protein